MSVPSFEDIVRANFVRSFTKKAMDEKAIQELLQDPRVIGALAGTGIGGAVGGLAGMSRGRSGLSDALRGGLIGGASGTAIGQSEHMPWSPGADMLGMAGTRAAVGGLIGQIFDRPVGGAALGATMGGVRGVQKHLS